MCVATPATGNQPGHGTYLSRGGQTANKAEVSGDATEPRCNGCGMKKQVDTNRRGAILMTEGRL